MRPSAPRPRRRPARIPRPDRIVRVACTAALLLAASATHAAEVYRCTDATGQRVFQDTPCAAQARQAKLTVAGQPLIDPGARSARSGDAVEPAVTHRQPRRAMPPRRTAKPPTSWECRAANGEVFYRHARCPSSVPGDGVVRAGDAETMANPRGRERHDAWRRVPVHGVKVLRSVACRRIEGAGAAVRDGHLRDERGDTYERLTGRDPCRGT